MHIKRYNLRNIMYSAWRLFRKLEISFSLALKMAWANAKATVRAKEAAGITEETHTWSGWKNRGYEVIHNSKALYKAITIDPTTKSGTRVVPFFGASQVQPAAA